MPKAVLVIDMPSCCGNCPFNIPYIDEMTEDFFYKCTVLNVKMTDLFEDEVLPDCPLKPLPEKRDLSYGTEGTEWYAYSEGYNACIDEMVEEKLDYWEE